MLCGVPALAMEEAEGIEEEFDAKKLALFVYEHALEKEFTQDQAQKLFDLINEVKLQVPLDKCSLLLWGHCV